MTRFCTQCGTQNDATAQFCESCGTPLRAATPAQPAPTAAPVAPVAKSVGNKKVLFILGGVAVFVVALAAVGAFLYFASPKRASEAHFLQAVEKYYAADKTRAADLTCLDNLPYATNPILTNPWDGNTNGWMNLLVEEGIYERPTSVSSGGYYIVQQHLSYRLSEKGRQAVRGNRLCFADGIKVKKALDFTQPKEAEKTHMAHIVFTYEYVNPAAWIKNPAIRQYLNRDFDNPKEEQQLVLKKDGWAVGNVPDEAPSAAAGRSSGGGLFSWLGNLFSRNPLIGKWRSDSVNLLGSRVNPDLEYEFTSSEMRTRGSVVKVRYEVKEGTVSIYPADGPSTAGEVFEIVDGDHIAQTLPFMGKITFSRVKD
jgi:hypothetical protein